MTTVTDPGLLEIFREEIASLIEETTMTTVSKFTILDAADLGGRYA